MISRIGQLFLGFSLLWLIYRALEEPGFWTAFFGMQACLFIGVVVGTWVEQRTSQRREVERRNE